MVQLLWLQNRRFVKKKVKHYYDVRYMNTIFVDFKFFKHRKNKNKYLLVDSKR